MKGNQYLACDTTVFNNCLLDNGLFDLGFCGQPFTWQIRTLKRRLDRVIMNREWLPRFGETIVKHLPKLKSNHIPLLLDFNLISLAENNSKPFKFLAPWLLHKDFKDFLLNAWSVYGDLK